MSPLHTHWVLMTLQGWEGNWGGRHAASKALLIYTWATGHGQCGWSESRHVGTIHSHCIPTGQCQWKCWEHSHDTVIFMSMCRYYFLGNHVQQEITNKAKITHFILLVRAGCSVSVKWCVGCEFYLRWEAKSCSFFRTALNRWDQLTTIMQELPPPPPVQTWEKRWNGSESNTFDCFSWLVPLCSL